MNRTVFVDEDIVEARHLAVIVLLVVMGCNGGSSSGPTSAATRGDGVFSIDGQTGASDAAVPDAALPDAVSPGSRIAWVNPAHCLSPCTFDPADTLVRVNRNGTLDPRGPHRVDPVVIAPLAELLAAARAAGHRLRIESAYRSYDDQAKIFVTTKQVGRAARPGHSEHQLGTALDLKMPTKYAITWLAEHATDHGFVVSYPAGKQRITGYRPEPWHVRFLGEDVAAELHREGWTLEELLRARPALGQAGTCDDCPAPASRAPCGDVPDAGRCDGTTLRWCFDGSLTAVDCATSHQDCGSSAGDGTLDCVDPAP